jgi:hypothetical protein
LIRDRARRIGRLGDGEGAPRPVGGVVNPRGFARPAAVPALDGDGTPVPVGDVRARHDADVGVCRRFGSHEAERPAIGTIGASGVADRRHDGVGLPAEGVVGVCVGGGNHDVNSSCQRFRLQT